MHASHDKWKNAIAYANRNNARNGKARVGESDSRACNNVKAAFLESKCTQHPTIMKGFLSFVLISIALLQTTAAAPAASEHFQAVKKSEGEQSMSQLNIDDIDIEKRSWMLFRYVVDDDDKGNYLVLVLFSSVLLTPSVKYAILENPEGMS
ncbi:hypothetical protein DFJ58DRAFT_822397 [Suillus subalutaceus]|uniref:uncharacterized protein n=1 Tax=Suillus subalutaceus TaxID=48586 RepID=UPI001B87AF10|nr:uncharacterized protein DFJ58DRAFT_822397 [Suillus subalutaceus]KAG1833255.1 hypothetical protein DFJ58DRAFT_822397 [Suillus subalutaceus]